MISFRKITPVLGLALVISMGVQALPTRGESLQDVIGYCDPALVEEATSATENGLQDISENGDTFVNNTGFDNPNVNKNRGTLSDEIRQLGERPSSVARS